MMETSCTTHGGIRTLYYWKNIYILQDVSINRIITCSSRVFDQIQPKSKGSTNHIVSSLFERSYGCASIEIGKDDALAQPGMES